jgi:hypothetical protein
LFQEPKVKRTTYRWPGTMTSAYELWQELRTKVAAMKLGIKVEVEEGKQQVWIRLEGVISAAEAEGLGQRIRESLERTKSRLVLDLLKLRWERGEDLRPLREKLTKYRSRIRVVLPSWAETHPEVVLFMNSFELEAE